MTKPQTRSMTGFGRGGAEVPGGRLSVELRTVNHKGLDVKVRLPRELQALEGAVLASLRSGLERGRVDATVQLEQVGSPGHASGFDAAAAGALVDAVTAFALSRGISPALTAGDLLRALPSLRPSEVDAGLYQEGLSQALAAALSTLQTSRAAEGLALSQLLLARLSTCAALVEQIAVKTAQAPEKARERLQRRLQALATEVEPQRLAQEVALLAERADTSEELERLRVHLARFEALVVGAPPAGRQLDFLCQELLREANTTASKAQDAQVAQQVVELKAEIERLREQVQNVE
jgi:uncharacterized protein (TIGR00255 family)